MAEDISFAINAKGAEAGARALTNVAKSADILDGSMGRLAIASNALKSAFAPLAGLWAGKLTFDAFLSFVNKANEAYVAQTLVAKDATDAQFKFAESLQDTLGISDKVTLGLMDQAKALGLSEDHLEQAAAAAIGISNITGAGFEESLKKVNQALRGNANALGEIVPGLQNLATEEQKLAAISALVNRGLEEQREDMEGVHGAQTRASNSLNDLLEVVGAISAPIHLLINDGIHALANVMIDVLNPAMTEAQVAMLGMRAVAKNMAAGVVAGVTAIEVVVENMATIFDASMAAAELPFAIFTENVKHALTVELPAYAIWFATNWHHLIRDGFVAAETIVKNFSINTAMTVMTLWAWVQDGFKGGPEQLAANIAASANRSLLEGFEATTTPLPEVIMRKLTEKETALIIRAGKLGAVIGTEFADKFTERMEIINKAFQDREAQVNLTQDKLAMQALGQLKPNNSELKAVESRIMTRGRADDPNARTADNTKAMLGVLTDMKELQEREAQKPEPEPFTIEVVGGL